ncbi:hypothetical protein QRQ56_23230 [Bradyrhizobium sp. U531]|uniref:hypothetical protein n=1 Tax=Bradyrhizobium sp. U531 TaxID=3053458 RepID=UPI003F4386DB
MSVERMHPPQYWQMRAEEFRTKAGDCRIPEVRETLRKVAANYDELARRAQRIRTLEAIDARRTEQAQEVVEDYAGDQRAIMGKLGERMN